MHLRRGPPLRGGHSSAHQGTACRGVLRVADANVGWKAKTKTEIPAEPEHGWRGEKRLRFRGMGGQTWPV
jgi:hypothetical protein